MSRLRWLQVAKNVGAGKRTGKLSAKSSAKDRIEGLWTSSNTDPSRFSRGLKR